MVKCLFDSMIYDRLVEDEGCRNLLIRRCEQGLVEVLVTHIQLDQLQATPDAEKRALLLAMANAIRSTRIPTDGAVWGLSKWGESKWGGGTADIKVDDIASGNLRHYADGLLVATAAAEADIFVTEETRLPKKIRRYQTNLRALSFQISVDFWNHSISIRRPCGRYRRP
jgi:hypothetical protein